MPLKDKTIAVIGVGNMGGALLGGLIDSGAVEKDRVVVHNRRDDKTQDIAKRFGVRGAATNAEAVEGADIVLVAVKPQIFEKVLGEIRDALSPDALVLSVAAGITTAKMEAVLGEKARVVRAMPNTPSLIKEGASAIAPGTNATAEDVEVARAILSEVSRVVVVDEIHLDAVTGLSGSGPAYIFLIIEAFADAGVKVGLSREIAQDLAVQTIQGAARLLQQTGEHPGRLKDMVTSPGGTAIAGLHTLEAGGLRTTIINAVEAATNRARELGQS
ncbi:MAG: pyrroline-5-carboxylate reductase [Deltaproteobacteria bacterium]|jgi:pyrroline-5-carboxylate reductase